MFYKIIGILESKAPSFQAVMKGYDSFMSPFNITQPDLPRTKRAAQTLICRELQIWKST